MLKNEPLSAAESPGGSTTGWLTTFNDLVTLLMVFFVLVFSTSSIDASRLKEFSAALQSGFGVLREGRHASVRVVDSGRPISDEAIRQPRSVQEQSAAASGTAIKVDDWINAFEGLEGVEVTASDQGILITVEGNILFDFGKADLHPQSHLLLGKIAGAIRSTRGPVQIEGHTDNVPIQTRQYPSNWELSTARAVKVLRYFVEREALAPDRFSAVGYGDARPRFPNDTAAQRSGNRRVEINLVTENGGEDV